MLKYIVLDIFTIIHLLILLPHMCYSVGIFLCILSYLAGFSFKAHLRYVFGRVKLGRESESKCKLSRVIKYASTEIITMTNRMAKFNDENGQFLMTSFILMSMPTNLLFLNCLLLIDMNQLAQVIITTIVVIELLCMIIISWSLASTSHGFHAPARVFVPVQARLHNVRAKLTTLKLFEMTHTNKVISVKLGPVDKVTHMRVFELIAMYFSYFLLIHQLIRDSYRG